MVAEKRSTEAAVYENLYRNASVMKQRQQQRKAAFQQEELKVCALLSTQFSAT